MVKFLPNFLLTAHVVDQPRLSSIEFDLGAVVAGLPLIRVLAGHLR